MSGVDLSHHNTITDTDALARAAEFVIHKATEGTSYRDLTYTPRIATLRSLKVRVGAYHFATGTGPAAAEADAFLAYAQPKPADILALDVEAGILTALPGQKLVTWCKTWLDLVRARTSIAPHIYMSTSVVNGRDWSAVAAIYPLWLAAYRDTIPAIKWWPRPALWQHTSTGRIPGVTGNVDLNIAVAAPKPDPKPAPPAPSTASDWEASLMARVSFIDSYELAKLMAPPTNMPEAKAREEATVDYPNETAALAGFGSYISGILRDVKQLQADVAALKGSAK